MIADTLSPSEYNFADGDISTFASEIQQPKQDMGISEEPDVWEDPEEPDELEDGPENEAEINAPSQRMAARRTAKFICHFADMGFATALSAISKNDMDEHRADKESLHELENAVAEYCKDMGGNVPPWLMIVICVLTIYGGQIPQALRDRKANTEREKAENERQELANRIAQLEIEKKTIEKMKKELQNGESNKTNDTAGV